MSGVPTVLIVEDEFAIADLLEMALTDEGYRVLRRPTDARGWSAWPKVRARTWSSPIT